MTTRKEKLELLEKARSQVPAADFLDCREYLQAIYAFLKANSRRYSYMQLSEDLGFGKTNIAYLMIKGQRNLTVKAGAKIVGALGLTGTDRRYFECLVKYHTARGAGKREEYFKTLIELKGKTLDSDKSKAQLEFFTEWYHLVIYEMAAMEEFYSDPRWIAEKMQSRIRVDEAKKSLQLLEELGLLAMDKEKCRHVQTKLKITTGDEIASMAVVRIHQKLIELGSESILAVREDLRDISALTIAITPEMVSEVKAKISGFRKSLAEISDRCKNANRVYQLNVQFFPLIKFDEDK